MVSPRWERKMISTFVPNDVALSDFMDIHAIRGMLALKDTPQARECAYLYDRIARYPKGVAWLEANRYNPPFDMPEGKITDRQYQWELLRRWDKHMERRIALLRNELVELTSDKN